MSSRFVAVLAGRAVATPPGADPAEFRLAMLEDTYEVVAGLEFVTPVLALTEPDEDAEAITWPGTRVVLTTGLEALLGQLADLGADQVAVVAHDAPDLPPLLLGKLFRALGSGEVAICPAKDGGLVALAARLPAPPWLKEIDLDTPDAPGRLRAAAGLPGAVRSGPGWHRLRAPEDLSRLDPGLEGWDNTRILLGGG
ncbi:hypothetical protein GCM10027176_50040 [Actinoallomurus bryophytorum]|uniref:Uncharacterized protein DUF2064 n=1 Tax=Actinoallomurus bryophytorum TaxID=1490222 RepID=A0A543CER3_9ACTN|nr:DUF2064 domain-containing protein [Actinoallomurus bryophytorum]TQL95584.1 uncharacterized protein DUF2064 [Actinoallomurus bryophytorum]